MHEAVVGRWRVAMKVRKALLWKAIKTYCTECSGGSAKERRLCECDLCPLYPYRNGVQGDLSTLERALDDQPEG